MASSSLCLVLSFFLFSILFVTNPVTCDDEADLLFQEINKYRTSLNLTTLTKNDNTECLAEQLAEQFKNQPCTNTTGANTVPGTETQFPNYPDLLSKCHLNVSDMTDGDILPACVPNLDPSAVLANYTESQYSQQLNDTKYTRAGIGSDGNWIVVVLATNATDDNSPPMSTATGLTSKIGFILHLLSLPMISLLLLN